MTSWWNYLVSKWGGAPKTEEQWRDPSPREVSPDFEGEPDDEPHYEGFDGALVSANVLFRGKGTLYSKKGSAYVPLFALHSTSVQLYEEKRQVTDQRSQKTNVLDAFRMTIERIETREEVFSLFLDDAAELQYCVATGSCHWPMLSPDGTSIANLAFRFSENAVRGAKRTPAEMLRSFIELFNCCHYCAMMRCALPPKLTPVTASTTSDARPAYEAVVTEMQRPSADDEYEYLASLGSYKLAGDDDEEATGTAARGTLSSAADDRGAARIAPEDELYSFDEATVTRSASDVRGGVNVCFADSVSFNRAIVINAKGGTGPTSEAVVQAHSYNERGMTGKHVEFKLAPPKGQKIQPTMMLLAEGERKAMFVDAVTKQLAEVDLERGAIVQQYAPGDEYPILRVAHPDKFGESTPQVVTCLNSSTAFAIDRRLDPTKCAVVESGKSLNDYMHKLRRYQKFTCHATSQEGHLAVGDLQGNIRLFSGTPGCKKTGASGYYPKTAKTLLRGSPNEPILHLDITSDGGYVLATCKTYLLVLCTSYQDSGKELCGFEARMGDKKPLPLKLTLSPEQVASLGGQKKVSFSKATFECNAQGEHWISASAGPYILTWNFTSVKKALSRHQAVAADSRHIGSAVRETAMSGQKEAICFLTDDAVGMQGRATARKSGKFSLSFDDR